MNTDTKGLIITLGGYMIMLLLALGFGVTLYGVLVTIVACFLIFIAFGKFLIDN